ncbi:DUF72 domain-containing protein [Ramlibacter albus]|uniref:DUF72 domain-containing protein n=1 Tax=Ramlibacter albus TaxID=2079448 RepID=A0A923M416_9BURK|nr:DUF72 domain-containing protein [Ramlibacter albus]MBC5763471.1 DUF72 domain-containing protein [Ramlibacter albus]
MQPGAIHVGCAGWSLPREFQHEFAPGESHLQRYASRFDATEINSSFHRSHKEWVWRRWADSVPAGFSFSVKLPKAITHERRLADCEHLLDAFLVEARLLGDKLACLLVQLPPSLAYDSDVASRFFAMLRARYEGDVALEPRHASWFEPHADAMLASLRVARVLADPVRHEPGRAPGGWPGVVYVRLHGSPRVYYSAYDPAWLGTLAARIRRAADDGQRMWCIFDNTASGAATGDALTLLRHLAPGRPTP